MRACDRQLIQFLHLKPSTIGAGALEIVAILFHVRGLDFVCIVVERTGGGMVKCDNDLHFRCQYGVVHSSDGFWSDSENPCHNSFPDSCRAQLFENNAYSVKRFSAAALVLKVAAKLAHGYEKVRHNVVRFFRAKIHVPHCFFDYFCKNFHYGHNIR